MDPTEPQDGTVTAKEKGKVKVDELEHVMYTDENGNPSTPLVSNVVRTLFVSPHTKKLVEVEAKLAQLQLLQAAQWHVLDTINAYHQTIATQLPSFEADVRDKAQAAVLQISARVSEAHVAFAEQQMQAITQLQAQFHANASQMQQVMAALAAQVPVGGTATGHAHFSEASSQDPAGLVPEGVLMGGREQRLGQASPMRLHLRTEQSAVDDLRTPGRRSRNRGHQATDEWSAEEKLEVKGVKPRADCTQHKNWVRFLRPPHSRRIRRTSPGRREEKTNPPL